MGFIERDLFLPALTRGFDRRFNGVGLFIGVKNHPPHFVPRRAAGRLDQRRRAAQEALLVGVENRHQRDLR